MATRKDWGQPQVGGQGFARTMKTIGRVVNMLAGDVGTINNVVGAFTVPAGFVVTGIIAAATDMDTGTPALTLSVGDAALATRYLNASVIGQAGTTTQTLGGGLLFKNAVETEILITVTAAAATAAAGTLALYLVGFIDN